VNALQQQAQILAATKSAAAASLAGGIISASGRPYSLADAMEVYSDCYHALHPDPGNGRYKAFKEDPQRMSKLRE
jgi:hypothetical protein